MRWYEIFTLENIITLVLITCIWVWFFSICKRMKKWVNNPDRELERVRAKQLGISIKELREKDSGKC